MTVEELLLELDQEAPKTRRALERVPEDQLSWRPHEKSLSLGQLALHVATLPGAIAAVAAQPTFEASPDRPRPSAKSVAELLTALDESVARARELIGGMTDTGLGEPWRMMHAGREIMCLPKGAVLRSILFNHWYHHRGQLSVYLRQTGALVPAIFGPSADENPLLVAAR